MALSTASKLEWAAVLITLPLLLFTKPSQADVEQEIKNSIMADINAAQINRNGEFLPNFITLSCKFDAESCYRLARAGLQVSYRNRVLFASVGISGNGPTRNCIGALKNIFCPSFLN